MKLKALVLIRNVKLDSCAPDEFGSSFLLLLLEFTLQSNI